MDALSLAEARPAAPPDGQPAAQVYAQIGGQFDLRQRREAFRDLMRLSQAGSPVLDVADRTLPGPAGPLAVRVYTPAHSLPDATLPGLLYLHGGGFVCGDLDTHDALCRNLCDSSGCRLVAVDYRRAPEHPFPAAVEDAYAATAWMIGQAHALRLDPARIAIAGDSAGATLAAVVCQRVSRTHPRALALQLLLCPILDWSLAWSRDGMEDSNSRRQFGRGYLLDRDAIARELACYLAAGHDPRDPRVSPLRAADLGGQPPTHIHTAEYDPLRDDGRAYAERLRAASVAVSHTCHAGMIHLFYGFGRLVPYARAALGRIGGDVRAALA